MCAVSSGGTVGRCPNALPSWLSVVRDAALVVVSCAVVALTFNALRRDHLPWIQREDYQLLVPCPETTAAADAVTPELAPLGQAQVLVLDARSAGDYRAWHVDRAVHVPYDYLEPTPAALIRRLAASGAQQVVVYGDGDDPDSGEQLARELLGKGLRNVRFVRGGAPALIAHERRGGGR